MRIWVCKVIRTAAVRVWMSVDVQTCPAIAVVWQSAGPARRPGEVLYPVHVPGCVPFLSLFENISFDVLPMKN